jgi:hypothetical protein
MRLETTSIVSAFVITLGLCLYNAPLARAGTPVTVTFTI